MEKRRRISPRMQQLATLIRKFFHPLKTVQAVYVEQGPKFTRLWVVTPVVRTLSSRAEDAVRRRAEGIEKLRRDLRLAYNIALISIAEARQHYQRPNTFCAYRRR